MSSQGRVQGAGCRVQGDPRVPRSDIVSPCASADVASSSRWPPPGCSGSRAWAPARDLSRIAPGPFKPSRESLAAWQVPDWFRDAKFGIWAHWGPQSAAEYGDWYARNMYIEGSAQYKYHVENYGHPVEVRLQGRHPHLEGRASSIPTPHDALQEGRREVLLQHGRAPRQLRPLELQASTRWNAVDDGPKTDIVGRLRPGRAQARLRFARQRAPVRSATTGSATSHGHDKTGPMAGVPYDGGRPEYADLYHDTAPRSPRQLDWNEAGSPEAWKQHWFLRIKDLIDKYQPDLLYTDGPISFRRLRPRHGRAPLQPERRKARRHDRSHLHQQAAARTARGHLRPRRRARRRRRDLAATRGRPTRASATGTTSAAVTVQIARRPSSTCWRTSSAATAT